MAAGQIPDAKIAVRIDAKAALQEIEQIERQLTRAESSRDAVRRTAAKSDRRIGGAETGALDRLREERPEYEGGLGAVRESADSFRIGKTLDYLRNISLMGLARSAVTSVTLGAGALPFDVGVMAARTGIPLVSGIVEGALERATRDAPEEIRDLVLKTVSEGMNKISWATDLVNRMDAIDSALQPTANATMNWAKAQLIAGGEINAETLWAVGSAAAQAAFMEAALERKQREWTLNELGRHGAASIVSETMKKILGDNPVQ